MSSEDLEAQSDPEDGSLRRKTSRISRGIANVLQGRSSSSDVISTSSNVISASSRKSLLPDPATSKPQMLDGEPVWPEYWGITRDQLRDLLKKLRAEPDWKEGNNVHTMVHSYIIPWTRGTGQGYAVWVNREEPKEVNLMVSHAWGENAEEFLDTLIRTCSQREVLFICALSLYQCEDGAGPTIAEQIGTKSEESPFRRILEHIRCEGQNAGWRWHCRGWLILLPWLSLLGTAVLSGMPLFLWDCVPLGTMCASYESAPFECSAVDRWAWRPLPRWPLFSVLPAFLLVLAVALRRMLYVHMYAGRMIVALNRELDIYSRLWCVYEIFVAKTIGIPVHVARTLAAAGKSSVRNATCSSEEDQERIRKEIEATTTFDAIDAAVYITAHKAWWKVVISAIVVGSAIAAFDLMFGMTFPICPKKGSWLWLVPNRSVFTHPTGALVFVVLVFGAKTTAYYSMLSVFSCAQGAPTVKQIRHCSLVMMAVGCMVLSLAVSLVVYDYSGPVTAGSGLFGLIWAGYGGGFWVYGLVLRHFPRFFRRRIVLYAIICSCLFVFFAVAFLHIALQGLLTTAWHGSVNRAHLYRILTNAAAGSFGSFYLPTYMFWHTAHWWGFQVKR